MSGCPHHDWNPQQEAISNNQRAAYDRMREQCPVAFSEYFNWSIFRHQDVLRTLLEDSTFSSKVSQHVSVPNGMDVPEHTPYRQAIEPYFSMERVAEFKPICQDISAELVANLKENSDIMSELADLFAARIQCAFMGWDQKLAPMLLDWLKRNSAAIHRQDRNKIKEYALEFEQLIHQQLAERRQNPQDDVTTQLMHEKINGQLLSDNEIASVLRNWTVGEVGTIAASVGIIVQFLAENQELQQQVRRTPEKLYYANDEILRLFNPLVDNRRRTTCPVTLGGRELSKDSRLTINWIAANRDPEVFEDADQFKWDRDPSKNLLYGAGVHICPGAGLAQMELVVVIRALLDATVAIELATEKSTVFAKYPMSGYSSVPVKLTFKDKF